MFGAIVSKFGIGVVAACMLISLAHAVRAEEHPAPDAAQLDAKVKQIQAWAADPVVVKAVKAQNAAPASDMTETVWKTLSVLDPKVRRFTRNDVARLIKSKNDAAVSEAFVSAADGTKVAFLSKPTRWSHAGVPKHEHPMKGEIWRGPEEVDESTGVRQMQIAVPVLDHGKPIGSLVVGLDISQLKRAAAGQAGDR
jgi:hypothetical protein